MKNVGPVGAGPARSLPCFPGAFLRALERVRMVLVATQHPRNIGSAARALKTMGFDAMHLVAPQAFPHPEASALAAGADDLLEGARIRASLAEAVAGCHLVLGSTATQRAVPMPELTPREAAARLLEASRHGEVALVFGPERTGLENAELQLCHASVCIPTDPEFSSLNLSQAVQVLAYELRLAAMVEDGLEAAREPLDARPPATHDAMERFFAHLDQTLHDIDFHKGRSGVTVMRRLRRLFLRAAPDEREVRVLHGILADAQRMARLAGQAPSPRSGEER